MRKFGISFAAVLVSIAAMFSITGCALGNVSPKDTWCSTEINYKGDNNAKLNVAFIYTEDGLVGKGGKTTHLKEGIELPADSITVVIWTTQKIESLGMDANQYYLKTYRSTSELLGESGWNKSVSGMRNLWTLIYLAKPDFTEAANQYPYPEAVTPMTRDYNGTDISTLTETFENFKTKFNWKDLLKSVVNAL
ncbi:MAG: hypothetical protein J1F14_03580 [Treponema sp.]|nr:hypothetical protein [Treponema sp.]